MTDPVEVTVLKNPGYWADRSLQLAELLGGGAAGPIGDPSGRPPDPETMLSVVDPGYWLAQPRELEEVLRKSGAGDQGAGEARGKEAGSPAECRPGGHRTVDFHGRGGCHRSRDQPCLGLRISPSRRNPAHQDRPAGPCPQSGPAAASLVGRSGFRGFARAAAGTEFDPGCPQLRKSSDSLTGDLLLLVELRSPMLPRRRLAQGGPSLHCVPIHQRPVKRVRQQLLERGQCIILGGPDTFSEVVNIRVSAALDVSLLEARKMPIKRPLR